MHTTSANVVARMTHFFRRAKSDSATCFSAVKMSIGYRLLGLSPGTRYLSTTREENYLDRVQQNQEIEEERKVLDVVQIVLQLLERVVDRGAVTVLDLGPAGDSRLHREPLHVVRDLPLEFVDELRPLGTRPDEAHVAEQHIEELGELVESYPTEESPHVGHARVAWLGPYRSRGPLRVVAHGAKLVEDEDAAIQTGAGLAVQDRPGGLELDRDGDEGHDGRRHHQADDGQGDVEETLDDLGSGGLDEAVRENEPAGPELRDQDLACSFFVKGRPILHGNAPEAAFEQRIGRESTSAIHLDHDHDIGAYLLD